MTKNIEVAAYFMFCTACLAQEPPKKPAELSGVVPAQPVTKGVAEITLTNTTKIEFSNLPTGTIAGVSVSPSLGLPPGFSVGKAVKWSGPQSAVLPSPGAGRIKEIAGVWALIEVSAPDNAIAAGWVCIPTAQLKWQIVE